MSKYFGYDGELDNFKNGEGKEKLGVAARVLAKTVANVGIWGLTELPKALITQSSKSVLNNSNASYEQKERARNLLQKFDSKKESNNE